ncbi:MAG: hypothetical protein ACRDEA_03400 [Microcystaceae cyanobacterium]
MSKKSYAPPAPSGKKYSLLRVSAATRKQLDRRQKELGVETQDELIGMLLSGEQTLAQVCEQLDANELASAMSDSGESDFKNFVMEALKKEIKFRLGLRSRHEGKDFSSIGLSELKRTRHIEA